MMPRARVARRVFGKQSPALVALSHDGVLPARYRRLLARISALSERWSTIETDVLVVGCDMVVGLVASIQLARSGRRVTISPTAETWQTGVYAERNFARAAAVTPTMVATLNERFPALKGAGVADMTSALAALAACYVDDAGTPLITWVREGLRADDGRSLGWSGRSIFWPTSRAAEVPAMETRCLTSLPRATFAPRCFLGQGEVLITNDVIVTSPVPAVGSTGGLRLAGALSPVDGGAFSELERLFDLASAFAVTQLLRDCSAQQDLAQAYRALRSAPAAL